MKTIILFCLLVLVGNPAHATVIISEDFEGTNTITDLTGKGWSLFNVIESGNMSILTTGVHGGTRALRYRYSGVHCGTACDFTNAKIYRSFSGQPEIWERYYVRYTRIDSTQPSGFGSFSAKQHYLKVDFSPNVSGGPNFVTDIIFGGPQLSIASQDPSLQTCPGPPYSNTNNGTDSGCNYYGQSQPFVIDGASWYCVETHIRFNTPSTANGIAELFINGNKTVNIQNGNWRDTGNGTSGTQFTNIEFYRQGSDNMYRDEDDYVMATTQVGCGSTPPADTTAPLTPTGVTIQ